MGKVLEMISRLVLVLALASAALSGCGGKAAALLAVPLQKALGQSAPAPGAVAAAKGPVLVASLPSQGRVLQLHILDRDGPVTTWATADGLQIMLRDGMLTQTRGLGMDMMSATVPSLAQITSMKGHNRSHHYLEGSDEPFRRDYSCVVEAGATDKDLPNARHLVETCTGPAGFITNHYWLQAGHLVKSKQWVSQGVGFAIMATGQQ